MINKFILNIALPVPFRRCFDYIPLNGLDLSLLKPGVRVRVPFQHRELIGIFLGVASQSDVPQGKLKPILEVIDSEPVLSPDILRLSLWAADYYHYPVGEVLLGALPGLLRQGKTPAVKRLHPMVVVATTVDPLSLNENQKTAVTVIEGAQNFQAFLLDGVTGSGKTEVYLQSIAAVLKRQQQVLVLVPEIGLTPQTIQRFRERFTDPVVAFHSGMTEKQRLSAWLQVRSGDAKIMIGTRSAVFTPFANLGLIIIDEEHDLSFKQQEGFRYHARDVAIMRAYLNHIPIVLGSATPSLETLYNVQQARYQHLKLPDRAGSAKLPQFHILNIRNAPLEQGLSPSLLREMQQHLQQGNQVMLFLNRRGFAPVLMCHGCGWIAVCRRCDMRMTYYQQTERLHCHHCDAQKKMVQTCENCSGTEFVAVGQGTERLEAMLTSHFPQHSITRIDRDTTRKKGSMEHILAGIHSGDHHILIGTQMLAKGHHFPGVTLVGIVDADHGFFSADFRAIERMGQLLLQVAGRAGRDEKPGKVVIQTHHPDHPLLHQLLYESYHTFASSLLSERKQIQLPPYVSFALFRAEAYDFDHARVFLQDIKNLIDPANASIQIMGPITAPMPRRAGRYRMQLLLQAKQRSQLQRILKNLVPQIEKFSHKQRVRWSLDVDPLEMF